MAFLSLKRQAETLKQKGKYKVNTLIEGVQWQGRDTYTTTKGKVKEIITGIPDKGFWRLWHSPEKENLRALGVTVRNLGGAKVGEKTVKGVRKEIIRKQWEVVIWPRPSNAVLVSQIEAGQAGEQPF